MYLPNKQKELPSEISAVHHLIEGGPGLRVTQQRFGRHDDQRLTERQSDLAPQDVEVRSRRGAVRHDPVAVVQLANWQRNILIRKYPKQTHQKLTSYHWAPTILRNLKEQISSTDKTNGQQSTLPTLVQGPKVTCRLLIILFYYIIFLLNLIICKIFKCLFQVST